MSPTPRTSRTTSKKSTAANPEPEATQPEVEAPEVEEPADSVPLTEVGTLGSTDVTITLPDGRVMLMEEYNRRLALLARPFPLDQIEKLPKQIVATRDGERPERFECKEGHPNAAKASADGFYCGSYHARSIHLDYVGHAGITMRLLEADPMWNWEPVLTTPDGAPIMPAGGAWIRLTVLGMTRLGFGDAAGKSGPNAQKEVIGDALRNAAMRFGVATYLWSKSDSAVALKMEAPEPVALPSAGLVERELAEALEEADPYSAVVAVGNKYGAEILRQVKYTRKSDGVTINLEEAVHELLRWIRGKEEERARAAAESAASNAQPDAEPRQDEVEYADEQREHEEQAARAARAMAEAEVAASAHAPAGDSNDVMRNLLRQEIQCQAEVLGIAPGEHVGPFLAQRQVTSIHELAPLVLRSWVLSQRATVIQALVTQGRATEAEAYERARANKEILSWAALTGTDDMHATAPAVSAEQGALI